MALLELCNSVLTPHPSTISTVNWYHMNFFLSLNSSLYQMLILRNTLSLPPILLLRDLNLMQTDMVVDEADMVVPPIMPSLKTKMVLLHVKYVVIIIIELTSVEGGMNLAPPHLDHKLILHQMPVCYHLPRSNLPHIQPLHPLITHGIQTQG